MFAPKEVSIEKIRSHFRLSPDGYLCDHGGTLIMPLKFGRQTKVRLNDGELVSYRRAVWACAHDYMPKAIYKKTRDGDERLSNLGDHAQDRRKQFQARVFQNGRSVSLGYYNSESERLAAVEEYKESGEVLIVKPHIGQFQVIRQNRCMHKVIGTYPTREDAEQVILGRQKYGQRVPGFAYSTVTGARHAIGMFSDAYQAKLGVRRWIISEGLLKGYDRFEKI
jgi:hypothetical protein